MAIKKSQQPAMLEGQAKKPLDIFGFIYRYGLIIIVAGFSILTMLIPLVLKVSKPNYETHAILKIDPVVASLITKSEDPSITGFYHDYVRTQARRISEFTLLKEAVERLSPEEKRAVFPSHFSAAECVPILRIIMQITPISRTHLVELSIRGPEKEGLAPMLNSVMEVYLQKMRDELVDKNKHRLNYLIEKKNSLAIDIANEEKEIQNVATAVLSSTFGEDFNIWQQRAVELQKSYVHMYAERVQAESAYSSQEKSAKQLEKLSLSSLVDEGVMDNRAIGFTSSWTYQQLQDMRASIDGVTKNNEDRKRVESRMQAMREYENTLREETSESIDSIVYGKQKLQLSQDLIEKENRFQETRQNEAMLKEAFVKAKIKSGDNSAALLQGQSLETQLGHDRDMFFRIDTRIHEMEAEARASLRVTIEAPARAPIDPAGSNTKKLLMLCVIISFGGVGLLFVAIEFFDNRIHSPKNIIHAFGYPPSWPISKSEDGIKFLDVIRLDSSSVVAKALRSLATRIFREFKKTHHQVFLFTAVDRRCGNTEIMLNTAQALAYHVRKVLVIDGNLLQADLFQKLNMPESHLGLEDILEGKNSFDECVYHDQERSIDILCSHVSSPSRFTTQNLEGFLKTVRNKYDIICIDSSPLKTCDFTEYLAIQSDVAVLISQGDSTLYRDLRQTAEILVRLEIPAIATVLNWGGEKKKIWLDEYLDRIPKNMQKMFASAPYQSKQD
ncbi:MAG: hypothetical protein OCC45_15195 [Desulfotalea sp.]